MLSLLNSLGLKHLNDFNSRLGEDIFVKVDISLIRSVLKLHHLKDENLVDTEESKYENINRILMLKYSRVIDNIKEIDSDGKGYRLETINLS